MEVQGLDDGVIVGRERDGDCSVCVCVVQVGGAVITTLICAVNGCCWCCWWARGCFSN